MLRRSAAVMGNDLRVIRHDAGPLALVVMIPLAMAFAKPSFGGALRDAGYRRANGAEQVVPGLSILLCFMMVVFVGEAFFREHRWSTWERLRASALRPWEIVLGKLVPMYVFVLGALVLLFGTGFIALDLVWPDAPLGLVPLLLALPLCLVALAAALVAVSHSYLQLSALANVVGLGLAGLGGALVPIQTLPQWVRTAALITPTYWAMRGFRSLFLEGAGAGAVILPTLMLLLFTVLFALVALWRFRFNESKSAVR
jgi:ABC-2 type transport system permease protein